MATPYFHKKDQNSILFTCVLAITHLWELRTPLGPSFNSDNSTGNFLKMTKILMLMKCWVSFLFVHMLEYMFIFCTMCASIICVSLMSQILDRCLYQTNGSLYSVGWLQSYPSLLLPNQIQFDGLIGDDHPIKRRTFVKHPLSLSCRNFRTIH